MNTKHTKDDQASLIALVALLISAAGFKEELSQVKLGDTSFTLLMAFIGASIAFGTLLYLHLLINAQLLLLQAWRQHKRSKSVLLLRFLYLAMLWIIPASVTFISASNWFSQQICFIPTEVLSDPFSGASTPSTCPSLLIGTIIPVLLAALITILVSKWASLRDRSFNSLPKELQEAYLQIQELRIYQAVSSDPLRVEDLQKKIDELEAKIRREMPMSKK